MFRNWTKAQTKKTLKRIKRGDPIEGEKEKKAEQKRIRENKGMEEN